MKKYGIKKTIILIVITLCLTGCFKRDKLEDVDIYTTVYPVEYVTDYLYGENSNVDSIYPAETNPEKYVLSKKLKKKYSKGAIFIYNGLTNEKNIARDLLNTNTDLKIIDVSQGLEYNNSPEELWMNPSDFLMLAHNIKNGLKEYISNKYIKEEIEKKYEELKINISKFDVDLESAVSASADKNIIIASKSLTYLDRYGFNVTDIANNKTEENINNAKELITSGKCKYIYMLDNEKENKVVDELVNVGATVKKLRSMTIRTENEVNKKITYESMMTNNIDDIKAEIVG